jgi:NADH-quinone oxidoreductase subunit J
LFESILFYVLAGFALVGGIGLVSSRQPVFATAYFLFVMLALAGLYIMLHLSFLFLTQILIAVGAIVAITLLVVSSINIKDEDLPKEPNVVKWVVASAALLVPFVAVIMVTISEQNLSFADIDQTFGSMQVVGMDVFTKWTVPFELVSVLLTAILIGAIVIVRKGTGK